MFFAQREVEQNVNFDAILQDEPSWYVVAATETGKPEVWLAYAQDRKVEDPKYSVSAFRQDIKQARLTQPAIDSEGVQVLQQQPGVDLPRLERRACPWIELFCVRSGKPLSLGDCQDRDFEKSKNAKRSQTLWRPDRVRLRRKAFRVQPRKKIAAPSPSSAEPSRRLLRSLWFVATPDPVCHQRPGVGTLLFCR